MYGEDVRPDMSLGLVQSDNTIELGAAAKLQPNLGNKLTRVHGEDVQPGITLVFVRVGMVLASGARGRCSTRHVSRQELSPVPIVVEINGSRDTCTTKMSSEGRANSNSWRELRKSVKDA